MSMNHISDLTPDGIQNAGKDGAIPKPIHHGDCSPDCPECGGVGYLRYEVSVGHPKFGKVERCRYAQSVILLHIFDPVISIHELD